MGIEVAGILFLAWLFLHKPLGVSVLYTPAPPPKLGPDDLRHTLSRKPHQG